jgi:hypothetical protein
VCFIGSKKTTCEDEGAGRSQTVNHTVGLSLGLSFLSFRTLAVSKLF